MNFYSINFIENTPNYILEPWLKKAKQVGYKVKPQYEQAILQKLKFINLKILIHSLSTLKINLILLLLTLRQQITVD